MEPALSVKRLLLRALPLALALHCQTVHAAPRLASAPETPAQPADPAAVHAIVKACAGKEDFSDPAPPARIFGNVWYVGTCTVSAILLTSAKGHVLIDAATEQAAPAILNNIRALGFRPRDVRWIVVGHEHYDHVGGLALLRKATGARIAAGKAAIPALTSGKASAADPQVQEIAGFTPVTVDRAVQDGFVLRTGALRLTALATPGHTEGSTSWRWTSCAQGDCRRFTYVDSLSVLPLGTYRLAEHPDRAAMFRKTFARVRDWRCGIVLTPHPLASDMFARMAGDAPLQDDSACRSLAETAETRLEKALSQ